MRIYFDSDKAWGFLSTHGFVYTLRKPGKSSPPADQEVEIWREGKSTGIKAVKVRLGAILSLAEDLIEYAPRSGFSNAEEWLVEAHRLSGESRIWDLFVVFVPCQVGQASGSTEATNKCQLVDISPASKSSILRGNNPSTYASGHLTKFPIA